LNGDYVIFRIPDRTFIVGFIDQFEYVEQLHISVTPNRVSEVWSLTSA
jgi:hypothetical protein